MIYKNPTSIKGDDITGGKMIITVYSYDIDNPAVCRALMDASEMHRQVQQLYNTARKEHHVLYRLDQGYLIVQSDIKPVQKGIFDMVAQYDMDNKINSWNEGQQFKFRIRTVPRFSIKGKKHYLKTEEDRIKWLDEQFKKNGISIKNVREKNKINTSLSSKENIKTGGHAVFTSWEYEGCFSIIDKQLFIQAYQNGIGSQKAYGCGLICLCG